MAKEGRMETAGHGVERGKRDSVSGLVIVLLVMVPTSWGLSLFFYLYLSSALLSSTLLPTQIASIANPYFHTTNTPSYTTSIYTSATNSHSHTTNTYTSATNAHSHATNTYVKATSTYVKALNTYVKATNTHSHPTNTYVKATKTYVKAKNTHPHATNTHPNAIKTRSHANAVNNRTNNINAFSNITNTHAHNRITHTDSTNIHAYGTTTTTSTSKSHPQDQSQKSSSHAAPAGSDAQCGEHYQEEGPMRQVVLWTPFWKSWDGWKNMIRDHGRLKEGRCPTWRCEFLWGEEVTTAQAEAADAVIFFSLDVLQRPLPLRSPHALWIWLELEAPPISQNATKAWNQLELTGVFFNLTMSYHHLNPITVLLGQFVPLSTPRHCPLPSAFYFDTSSPTYTTYSHHMQEFDAWLRENGEAIDARLRAERDRRHGGLTHRPGTNTTLTEPLPDDYSEKKAQGNETPLMEDGELMLTAEEIAWATRPRMAAWMASHCPTDSRRETLVVDLGRFLAITTVGECGELKCGKNHMDMYCYSWLAASHLFYLSFENALCDDYHTEKLWRPLEYGMVPVVYGGPSYRNILPFDSYIEVSNFSSASALATHLLYLATHPSAYLRYMQWRRYWWVNWPVHWCSLCAALHRQTQPTCTTMDHWWNNTATCYDPLSW